MDSTSVSVHEAEKRLLTVKQQIEKLKAWNKVQENRLAQKIIADQISGNKNVDKRPLKESNCQSNHHQRTTRVDLPKNILDEQPIIPVHSDFESLLNAKLKDENCKPTTSEKSKKTEKRTFLRKGEGLSRFRMKPEDFKLTNRNRTFRTASVNAESKKKNSSSVDRCGSKENTALEAFELLEQQTNDSSFSSTSSTVAQLMEDSIKSTPIKAFRKKKMDEQLEHHCTNLNEDYDFFGIRMLGVIDEEPSKFEESSRNSFQSCSQTVNDDKCKLIIVRVSNDEEYQHDYNDDEEYYDHTDCSSRCSCCMEQDTSHFTTPKSISLFTEKTTTMFSPAKSECTREVQFYKTASEESASLDGENENQLRTLLHTRLRELENEIDAFRHENSHLTKLRENYEAEYTKFCEEKGQLLAKIRAEHLQSIREIDEEKKKLTREKAAFEKYMKEVNKKPNKHEKEEIRLLKEEIKLLKEEMSKKESRWGAAQARIRTEVKQLKDLNALLKDELKELRELKTKKVTFAPVAKNSKPHLKTVAHGKSSHMPEVSSNPIDTTNELLQQLEFSDSKYIDKVRSLACNLDSSNLKNSQSVCVNSCLNNTLIESNTSVDVAVSSEKKESCDENGNIVKLFPDGRKEIWYANGNIKKISPDGKVTKTVYFNGDVKEVLENEIVKYYYAESKIWHSEYGNGLKIMEFPDGQVEKRFKDGSLEITYPNGTVYEVNAKGEERWTQIDGTVIMKNITSDEKRIIFPNGQVEIHTTEYKRREYPDGTVKTVYIDGRQETKYWNGRVRLKTRDGTLLSDTDVT